MCTVERQSLSSLSPTSRRTRSARRGWLLAASAIAAASLTIAPDPRIGAQAPEPTMTHPDLAVRTVVTGLDSPTTMAFIGRNDMLVLEKNTGRVQRVVNGKIHSTVLDLAVNFGSERGLLGIALHPRFPRNPGVYLYWTESSTGADTNVLAETPLLGNRVDRFEWNGSALVQDINLIRLRAIQQDATNPAERGNHDGGVLAFEIASGDKSWRDRNAREDEDGNWRWWADGASADGGPSNGPSSASSNRSSNDQRSREKAKLLIFVGDLGRRGQMQNLVDGPFGPGQPDDQFGGPEPDDAHLSGVVLRLNDDGTSPTDNPFYDYGALVGGEVGANLQKVFAFGFRNSFGIAVDPRSGDLWTQENGDDSFSEINRIEPGTNCGWVQIMGPIARLAEFKGIETSASFFGLQQVRWPPTLIADTPAEALGRLNVLPESKYSDPEFSWKFEVAPAGIGFVESRALGREFAGDLFVGASRPTLSGGYLFRFNLADDRRSLDLSADPRLADRVADNVAKFEITESESLLIGMNFGVGTDIETGPNGNVYVVSLSNGAIYEISRRRR
jgi:glucose/arabinose dehydrogenase